MKRFTKAWTLLHRRGLSYLIYLAHGYVIPRLGYYLLFGWPRPYLRQLAMLGTLGSVALVFTLSFLWFTWATAILVACLLGMLLVSLRVMLPRLRMIWMRRQARAGWRRAHASYTQETFTSWPLLPVSPTTREAVATARRNSAGEVLVIGHIDADGRVLGVFGELPGLKNVSRVEFLERHRFPVDIVLLDGKVLVRKEFQGNKDRFVREWYNLVTLHSHANVPAVYRVDEKRCLLFKNFIHGKTVRDILVDAGANILNAQTAGDPELAELDRDTRLQTILARGTALIPSRFPKIFPCELAQQMNRIHALGVANLSLTFGNIIVDYDGAPWFIDMEGAQKHASTSSLAFRFKRDRDREKFNRIYGADLLTEKSARAALAEQSTRLFGWYAPIDFGSGLTVGGIWSIDSGTGRWDYLNGKVMSPLLVGKRVLDLGSNNGVMPMLMLRAGAREVVGIELLPVFVETAQLVHRIFEWRDMRQYAFKIHNGSMMDILHWDWGEFDVVTSLCSLYYLPPEDMARVVRRAAQLAPMMIVQANVDTRAEALDSKAEKSAPEFLKKLLENNGFPKVEVFTPPNFSRPLLIGTM